MSLIKRGLYGHFVQVPWLDDFGHLLCSLGYNIQHPRHCLILMVIPCFHLDKALPLSVEPWEGFMDNILLLSCSVLKGFVTLAQLICLALKNVHYLPTCRKCEPLASSSENLSAHDYYQMHISFLGLTLDILIHSN